MRLLLITDDQDMAELLVEVLTDQHYVVDVAINGQAGWELIRVFDYQLLLLDLVIPKLDGICLCQKLRFKDYRTSILLLAAGDPTRDQIIALDAGAGDYIVKPYKLQDLLTRIRTLSISMLCQGTEVDSLALQPQSQLENRELNYARYRQMYLKYEQQVRSRVKFTDPVAIDIEVAILALLQHSSSQEVERVIAHSTYVQLEMWQEGATVGEATRYIKQILNYAQSRLNLCSVLRQNRRTLDSRSWADYTFKEAGALALAEKN